jgi:hypothetical protein
MGNIATLFIASILTIAAAFGQPRPCPKPTFEQDDNAYDFNRSSTVGSDKQRDVSTLEHCIETLNGKPMQASWAGPHLNGWALPERALRSQIPTLSEKGVNADSTLTYGVAQKEIPAPYLEVQDNKKSPEKKEPDAAFTPLVNRFELAIGSEGELNNFISINAEFVSQATRLVNGEYLYQYTWHNRGAIQRLTSFRGKPLEVTDTISSVSFRLRSASVSAAWAETTRARIDTSFYFIRPEVQSTFVTYKEPPEPQLVDIDFMAADRETTVGQTSVLIYSPKTSRSRLP